jgi:hypothetical protein
VLLKRHLDGQASQRALEGVGPLLGESGEESEGGRHPGHGHGHGHGHRGEGQLLGAESREGKEGMERGGKVLVLTRKQQAERLARKAGPSLNPKS